MSSAAPPVRPAPTGDGALVHPGRRSRTALAICWLVMGAAMVAVPLAVGLSRWETVLSGHPLFLFVVLGAILLGLIGIAWAVATLFVGERVDEESDASPRTPRQVQRRATRRLVLAIPLLVLSLLLVLAIGWARPFAATPQAVAVTRPGSPVLTTDTLTWYELAPAARDRAGDLVRPTIGLVFVPGARIDPRAYATMLEPLVQAGYLVIVLKEPFGLATVDPDHAARAMAVHPEVVSWLVAGHSVGGRVAATFADTHPQAKALLMLASTPATTLGRGDLQVAAVYGTADRITSPDEVEQAAAELPAGSRVVAIDGASHSSFADCAQLPGDGVATAGRSGVYAQVALVTTDLLVAITPAPPPKKQKK